MSSSDAVHSGDPTKRTALYYLHGTRPSSWDRTSRSRSRKRVLFLLSSRSFSSRSNTTRPVSRMGSENIANSPETAGNRAASSKDPRSSSLDPVTSITHTSLGSTTAEMVEHHVEGASLLSSVVSGEVQSPPSDSHVPAIDGATVLQTSLPVPTSVVEATVHIVESSTENPTALVENVVDTTGIHSAEDIKDKAEALALARLRAIVFTYAAKLPIVGSYFVEPKRAGDIVATETTPLLGAIRDPKAFATEQAEGLLRRLFSPLLNRIPDVDALDNAELNNRGPLFKAFVECYALARDGGGWLFTHLQEHSLVIAPVISLGHLSTADLAASTIGTAVSSVTGYSIVQGFISSLDKILAGNPTRRAARIACAQAAIVTGVTLFPITSLWTIYSATILQRLGQPSDVAGPASEFLRITAAGLPGYAISEIAKRYLTSQGLSSVHTRILSITAPLNLFLNYLLVNGPIPALRLGFAGAPLCTVLSHNVLAVMLIVYIVQRTIREEVEYLRSQNVVPDEPRRKNSALNRPADNEASQHLSGTTLFSGFGTLIFAGVSGVLKSASQLWSKDFGGVVACMLGPEALATQAVLLTTATTLYQAPKAIGNASSDRIKKWVARGDMQHAKIAAFVAFLSTLGGVFVIGNVLLAFATSWGRMFNNDPIILENVSAVLPVIAIFQAVHGIGAWVDSSLGAVGKTAVFPSLNASTDYVLGIPLGVYLALMSGWGLAGLWAGLSASLAYSSLVAIIVLLRTNWKKATREKRNTPEGDSASTPDGNERN